MRLILVDSDGICTELCDNIEDAFRVMTDKEIEDLGLDCPDMGEIIRDIALALEEKGIHVDKNRVKEMVRPGF